MSDNFMPGPYILPQTPLLSPSEMILGYPSARLAGASRLSETPGRGNIRLKSTAIWGMQVININAACRALAGSVWSTIRFLAKAIMTGSRVSAIRDINIETYARELGVLSGL